jgi:DNA-3-methyladenine glycosylase I
MGRSVYDDTTLFEFYSLKPFKQAKLDNNLEQRENFKAAFDHFDYKKIAL